MNLAVGYIRVSTKRQVTDGISLAAQKQKIEKWCKANGYTLSNVHHDKGISGKRMTNRPGLMAAIQEAVAEGRPIVVYSLSRLSRSLRDLLDISDMLQKGHADLISLTEKIDTTSPAGNMVFRMMGVLAQFEREIISSRVKDANVHLRSRGLAHCGSMPYGYDRKEGGKVVLNLVEQEVIAKIKSLRSRGASWPKIARILNKHGVPSKECRGWYAMSVYRIAGNADRAASMFPCYEERMALKGVLPDSVTQADPPVPESDCDDERHPFHTSLSDAVEWKP